MIVDEDIFVMLLTEEKFKTFTPKKICDATQSTEVLVCLSCESRQRSTTWFVRPSPPAEQPITNRRTMASCTGMDFRIWMATFGNSSSWSPALQAKARGVLQTYRRGMETMKRCYTSHPALLSCTAVHCVPSCQARIERREHHAIHAHVLLRRE